MIAIKSNKDLFFPSSYKGKVKMTIDMIQNKPEHKVYDLRIIDTCHTMKDMKYEIPSEIEGEDNIVELRPTEIQLGNSNVRYKTLTYDELDVLASVLDVDTTDKNNLRENINELFRQGLLLITQQECQKGEGMYFSEANDWEILR